MSQTRMMSAIESICNVGSGFIIAMILWRFVVTPFLGIEVSYAKNFQVTCLFTVASLARLFIWRRLFNKGE